MCAALLELLGEKAFDQIQITEITQRANLGYATFFRHYGAKEDVLAEIAADEIAALFAMTIPALERAERAVSCLPLCQYVDGHRTLWRTLLTGGASAAVRAEFVRQARAWAQESSSGRVTPVPVDLGTVCCAGATIDALAWWMERPDEHGAEEIAGWIDRLVILPFVGGGAK